MNTKILITGAVVAILAAGAASASPRHHKAASGRETYVPPAQPIPYAQLDAYLKASPKERMAIVNASTGAATGTETNTSAAVPSASAAPVPEATPTPAAPAAPASDMDKGSTAMPSAGQPVNPPAPPPATTPPTTPDASTAPK